jgi:riboflavin kinase/FMN adenylyltransferase
VESFLLDFNGDDLPGEPLAIEFWARLRDEVRYEDVEDLVAAIGADVGRTMALVPSDALA